MAELGLKAYVKRQTMLDCFKKDEEGFIAVEPVGIAADVVAVVLLIIS